MKKLLLLSTAVLFLSMHNQVSATNSAQRHMVLFKVTQAPPAAVLTSFNALFGNAPVTQWKLRSDGTWRAHFTLNGKPWEATFAADGRLLKSEPK
jgi:hypothetical protein